MPDDIALSYAEWESKEEQETQENVVICREYYKGNHDVPLTERQKKFLGFKSDGRFALNYCRGIVAAMVERLQVKGFESTNTKLASWAWDVWTKNRMDAKQLKTYKQAIRDSISFVIVDWDEKRGVPRFTPHWRYTDEQYKGDGFGCKAHYPNGDDSQPMEYASKRWTEDVIDDRGKTKKQKRLNLYYPDRVEKYVLTTKNSEAGWQLLEPEKGEKNPLEWVDKAGEPLGIPVIPFPNEDMESELWDAIPIQDAVNKTALSALAEADANGFRILLAKGFNPTIDGKIPNASGSNLIEVFPGCWIGIPDIEKTVEALEAADIAPTLNLVDSLIMKLAQVTDTPTGRFQITRQVAAEDTLKQQESPLIAKLRTCHVVFGNAWEDCLYMARKLQNLYGTEKVDEDADLSTLWQPTETRIDREVMETLAIKREKLSVPTEFIWSEAGYDQDMIDKMKESPEYQARISALGTLQANEPVGSRQNQDNQRNQENVDAN